MKIRFVKMHGCGNDYVYIDAINQPEVAGLIGSEAWRELVMRMSDRHKGIGSDGVIAVCEPTSAAKKQGASVRMRMFNADASEGEMCGNGVRCVAKFAHDRLGVEGRPMRVETGRGVLGIEYEVEGGKVVRATVDMGRPIVELEKIPIDYRHLVKIDDPVEWGLRVEDLTLPVSFVSMGNPHAVMFVDDVESYPLDVIGPQVERHPAFPNRVNFHIVQTVGSPDKRGFYSEAIMRTWERGSGLTQACGTGACAVYVVGGRVKRLGGTYGAGIRIHLPGGDLRITSDGGEGAPWTILMTGPAEDVFEGEYRV